MHTTAVKNTRHGNVHTARTNNIFLVRGMDTTGKQAWYYVLVDKSKRDIFKSRNGVPHLKLTDYGQILYSGYGNSPPESTISLMKNQYGFSE